MARTNRRGGLPALIHRSGVSAAEVARALPGDDLVPDPGTVMDRAMNLPAAVEQTWPWLVQLGKRRAGWYLPRGVERFLPRSRRAAWSIDPRFQDPQVGVDVPDWGPGDPVFRTMTVAAPTTLVYLSLRQRSAGWRWPADGAADGPGVLGFSWALVLEPTGPQTCRLHIRLRMKRSAGKRPSLFPVIGGLLDWATIALLERGLSQRLRAESR